MNTRTILIYFYCLLCSNEIVFSQITDNTNNQNSNTDNYTYSGNITIAKGFNGINLGTSLQEVKKILQSDALYLYKEREIQFLSETENRNLTVKGSTYIDNAYFVFSKENKLISLSLFLDKKYLDYSTVYQLLAKKYGRPELSVNTAIWTDNNSSLILETPLHIKYIFNSDITDGNSNTIKLPIEQSRQKFLELF